MNVLVTVGTTPFDELIEAIDSTQESINMLAQISDGNYTPKCIDYIRYSNEIDDLYDNNDIIITHAGAGSVYKLLEKKKEIIVCPNVSRSDNHQLQLAKYLEEKKYCKVCYDISELKAILKYYKFGENEMYNKVDFFGTKFI